MTWRKPTSPSHHPRRVRVHNLKLTLRPALFPPPCRDTLHPRRSSYCSRLAATPRSRSTPLLWRSSTCWPSARPWVPWVRGNTSSRTRRPCFLPPCRLHHSLLSQVWHQGCAVCPCRAPFPCRWAWRQNHGPASAWLTLTATWAHITASQPDVSTGDARRGRTDRPRGARCPPPFSLPPRRHPPSAIGTDSPNRRPTAEQIHQRS